MMNALELSKYIINYCLDNNHQITGLKLQKFLYFLQAYFWIEKKCPCFYDTMVVSDIGPMVPEVYKKFQNAAITDRYELTSVPAEAEMINDVIECVQYYTNADLYEVCMKQAPCKKKTGEEIKDKDFINFFLGKDFEIPENRKLILPVPFGTEVWKIDRIDTGGQYVYVPIKSTFEIEDVPTMYESVFYSIEEVSDVVKCLNERVAE